MIFSESCKNFSIRHMIAYKVWGSILGVQRTHFRPNFTFPAGSGRIIDRIIKIQKSRKIAKNHDFHKKNRFFSKGLYWLIWWSMGRNWPLGVFKAFFKQHSIFTLLLDKFWKNRGRKIFFLIFFLRFFTCGSPKNMSIEYPTGI